MNSRFFWHIWVQIDRLFYEESTFEDLAKYRKYAILTQKVSKEA